MPKQKITKEMVVDTAFDIARKDGMDRVLIKKIAGKLLFSPSIVIAKT